MSSQYTTQRGLFFGRDDCRCGCCNGCVVTEFVMYRPHIDNWPTEPIGDYRRCGEGFSKYKKLTDIPKEKRCSRPAQWRIINVPTCQVISSGKICNGELEDLPNSVCYPAPYIDVKKTDWGRCNDSPTSNDWACPENACPKLPILLIPFLMYLSAYLDLGWLMQALGMGGIAFGLHCGGDLRCRYVIQLQLGCLCPKSNKVVWPGGDPCTPNTRYDKYPAWNFQNPPFPVKVP